MTVFYRCPYYDCGWCYAPEYKETTATSGQCNNKKSCKESIKVEEDDYADTTCCSTP